MANQSRTIEELRGIQEHVARILTQFEKSTQETKKTEISLPENLDLTKDRQVKLFEEALVEIACLAAGEKEKSFRSWMKKKQPLTQMRDFFRDGQNFLHEQLGKLVGDEDPRKTLYELINKAKDEEIFLPDQSDPKMNPYQILSAMNTTRNRLEHARKKFNNWERWNLSILYLMNLAMIWSKVEMQVGKRDE